MRISRVPKALRVVKMGELFAGHWAPEVLKARRAVDGGPGSKLETRRAAPSDQASSRIAASKDHYLPSRGTKRTRYDCSTSIGWRLSLTFTATSPSRPKTKRMQLKWSCRIPRREPRPQTGQSPQNELSTPSFSKIRSCHQSPRIQELCQNRRFVQGCLQANHSLHVRFLH
jgi:hypothetical protein